MVINLGSNMLPKSAYESELQTHNNEQEDIRQLFL